MFNNGQLMGQPGPSLTPSNSAVGNGQLQTVTPVSSGGFASVGNNQSRDVFSVGSSVGSDFKATVLPPTESHQQQYCLKEAKCLIFHMFNLYSPMMKLGNQDGSKLNNDQLNRRRRKADTWMNLWSNSNTVLQTCATPVKGCVGPGCSKLPRMA